MEMSLLSKILKLWDTWDIRVFLLTSLFLQLILRFYASVRKRTAANWATTLVSIAYFLSEWLSPYTLGLISDRQLDKCTTKSSSPSAILAFWAPFLLFHLGGSDNLISLSLDENEKWLRHLVHLFSHVFAVTRILIGSLPSNTLILPTILLFVAGIIKYLERTWALYLASSSSRKKYSTRTQVVLEPNPGPDYEKLSRAYLAMKEANLPIELKCVELPPKKFKPNRVDFGVEGELDDSTLLKFAECFYVNCKGFLGGFSTFSPQQRQITRDFFLRRNYNQAFKLLELMLNFLHEDLHTKTVTVSNRSGYFVRMVSLSSTVLALLFSIVIIWRDFSLIDIILTAILFYGAILPEISLMLSARSVYKHCHWLVTLACVVRRRRWSESVAISNLIRCCLHGTNKLTKPIFDYVKEKIFDELKKKSESAENVQIAVEICSQRGDRVIAQSSPSHGELKWSLGEVEYVKSLLLWHIATDLCYNSSSTSNVDQALNQAKDFCKIISEYMLYLLVLKPTMMAPVAADWQQIFQDTCADAKRFFRKRSLTDHRQACEQILSVNTEIEPAFLKGDASKSVLFDACRLAHRLLTFEEQGRWELMSRVWVDLLAYAAVNCEATVHAQQPSQGGELLTFVWLLMNQLGLGNKFSKEVPRTGYKMVVQK